MQATIQELITTAGDLIVTYALDVLGAILLLIGGWMVAGWARRAAKRGLDRVDNM
ncbi:MAG: mechanosensitive ion channel family protein, partial [Alphaproteobacteria bacterium]|nr:mechanosensitive ion channel family protein [Alphaproteobacteria bacterium]